MPLELRLRKASLGSSLHEYVIVDAIRDERCLKFKVDYNNVVPKFKSIETEKDELKLSAAENKKCIFCTLSVSKKFQSMC